MNELETFDVFRTLSDHSKERLEHGLLVHRFPKSQTVIQKGSSVSGAYVVIGGQLRVFTITPQGNEATLYFIRPGEICVLALNCIFNNLLYPAWVQAEAGTSVGVIPAPVYRMLFQHEPSIQNLTVNALSVLVFRLMSELEEIHSLKLDERLAKFLLLKAGADGVLRITQSELAAHLGTTREVIARLIGKLVAEKSVATTRGAIAIKRPEELAKAGSI